MLLSGDISQSLTHCILTHLLQDGHALRLSDPTRDKAKDPPGLLQELGLCGSPSHKGTQRRNRDMVGSQHLQELGESAQKDVATHKEPLKFYEATRKN